MALLPWDDEEDKKKDELYGTPVKAVTSVQSGAWQPAPSGADAPAMGDGTELAQNGAVDQQPASQGNYLLSEEKAQADEAKRQRDAQIAEARRQAAAQQAAQAMQVTEQTQEQPQPKSQKYTPVKGEGGVKGFLKGVGASIQQGLATVADVGIQAAAIPGGLVKDGKDLVNYMAEVEKVRANLHNKKDITGNKFTGTQDVEQQALNIVNGKASLRDVASVTGKGMQVGLDATMFLNPARGALLGAKGLQKSLSPIVRYAARDAAFFGTLQGTATFQRVYGETGDMEAAIEAAAKDAAIGGALQGTLDVAGQGIGVGANRTINSLRRNKQFDELGNEIANVVDEAGVAPTIPQEATPVPQDGNINFQPDTPQFTPVADGVPTQLSPDGLQPVRESTLTAADQTPMGRPVGDQIPNQVTPATNVPAIDIQPARPAPVADGVAQQADVVPAIDPNAPTVKSEQLKLQESRAGTSQAEEAGINQQLQEVNNTTPVIENKARQEGQPETQPSTQSQLEPIGNSSDSSGGIVSRIKSKFTPLGQGGYVKVGKDPTPQYLDTNTSQQTLNKVVSPNAEVWRKWFHGSDHTALPAIEKDIQNNPVLKDAGNSRLYDYYKSMTGDNISFNDFMNKDLTLYRGGNKNPNNMSSYSLLERKAKRFGDVSTITVKPKDTYGMLGDFSEGEIFVPKNASQSRFGLTPLSGNQAGFVKVGKEDALDVTPVKDVPPADNVPEMDAPSKKSKKKLSPKEQGKKNFADRFMQASGNPQDLKAQLARSLDMGEDTGLDIADLTKEMSPKAAARTTDLYNKIEKIYQDTAKTAKANRKDFMKGNDVDMEANRQVSSDTAERGVLEHKLRSEIRALNRKGDIPERAVQALENLVKYRTANMLNSASVVEKAVVGDTIANVINTIKNPIKQARGITQHGNVIKSGVKASFQGTRIAPKNASEALAYVTGNTLKAAFTPVEIAARARRGALRTELTKWAHQAIAGKDLTFKEAENLSRTASNHTEMLVGMGAGVDNFMVSATDFNRALKHWKKFMETGSKADLLAFEKVAEAQGSLANKLAEGFKSSGGKNKGARALIATANAIFPFVRVAYNAANTGVVKVLYPFSQSVVDSIRADQRGFGANAVKILQNKLVDYGLLGGAAMLAGGGLLIYNDGDEVDKPRGWSLKVDDNNYVPVRGTPIEFPLAVAGTTREIIKDVDNGESREPDHYIKMVGGSLPYLDQLEQNSKVWDSLTNLGGKEGDGGYAAKQYGTTLAKSLTPYSNNSAMPVVERWKGNSVNAKSTYDKDSIVKTYTNSLKSAYNKDRDSLKDSRDNAGRVRTVDNQGALINKTTNDESTAEFNDRITNLVEYGREAELGKDTQDMFNTYDTGKNNNFKSALDSITFLDAPEIDGKATPDDAKKLEKNAKYTDLSNQIREGFYGETSDELLTLDGKNLYSDVSMPNADGTKDSRKPINMQSIKNAIAQTDLPEAERNRMYEISQANQALYAKVESKEMTYAQYKAIKAESEKEYVTILSNSKNYKKMVGLFDHLDNTGFFKKDGLGSTRSGQTYLWNSLNALLGSKGATPAADYPKDDKGFGSGRGGGGSGRTATTKAGINGIQWTPAGKRQMASVPKGKYTPFKVGVKLGNEVKRDRTQNYSDRSF